MLCYQCEQTAKGTGCTAFGVCGKDPETAALQDLLVFAVKGISLHGSLAAGLGARDAEVDRYVVEALFSTITNVNFSPVRLEERIRASRTIKEKAKKLYEAAAASAGKKPEAVADSYVIDYSGDLNSLIRQGEAVTYARQIDEAGPDIAGLRQLILFGLKGMAAYADHALILGKSDPAVFAFFHEALSFLAKSPTDLGALLAMALKVGEVNLKVMELLDAANIGAYGSPEPTQVRVTAVKGKAILVSGHDLKDLDALLRQTEGKGINVYTHGEMLPCNAYPGLKKYKHLVGNYGGAWQNQRDEFDKFPGAILMTTNCIQKPKDTYKERIFTCGLVEWPGVMHIRDLNFKPVIDAALAADGFPADEPEKKITIGFGHDTVMSVAGTVVDAVKSGAIKHFFLIGGCDGAKSGRDYYTQFAEKVPDNCVILTLACGKYRFNKLEFGAIGGIPRLLDVGQCNDAYSAIQIAVALAKAFNCGVNDLPLSMILSWYEQKAVCILLTLLHLGIRNIRLGPSLPAFVTPAALKILVEKFNIMPIKTPEEDLKAILGLMMRNTLFTDEALNVIYRPLEWRIISSLFEPEASPVHDRGRLDWTLTHVDRHPIIREVLFSLDGDGFYGYKGEVYPCRPGTVFLFDTFEPHDSYYPSGCPRMTHLWISIFEGDVTVSALYVENGRLTSVFKRPVLLGGNRVGAAGQLGSCWDELKLSTSLPAEFKRAKIVAALSALLLRVVESGYVQVSDTHSMASREELIAVIKRNIAEVGGCGVSLSQAAKLAGYSKFHFLRLFKKESGMTFHEYVDACRLKRLNDMLRSRHPKKEIAAALGFSSSSALLRWTKNNKAD